MPADPLTGGVLLVCTEELAIMQMRAGSTLLRALDDAEAQRLDEAIERTLLLEPNLGPAWLARVGTMLAHLERPHLRPNTHGARSASQPHAATAHADRLL